MAQSPEDHRREGRRADQGSTEARGERQAQEGVCQACKCFPSVAHRNTVRKCGSFLFILYFYLFFVFLLTYLFLYFYFLLSSVFVTFKTIVMFSLKSPQVNIISFASFSKVLFYFYQIISYFYVFSYRILGWDG